MKINNIKDINKFFTVVDSCEGRVEIVSKEGDRLNLKSQLTKYVSLAKIFSSEKIISEIELVCYESADVKKIIDFMMNQ